jgi:hypothetical protein
MKQIDDLLTALAREHLHIETLETRRSDSLDFHEVSVRGVKDGLRAAYQAGQRAAARQGNAAIPRGPASWHVVNETGMPEIRAGGISIADIRLNGHNMEHGEVYARRIVAAVNACRGIGVEALEAHILRDLRDALERAAFLMRRVHEGDHRALENLPSAERQAGSVLARVKTQATPRGVAGAIPPIAIVTVRAGCVETIKATVPLRVILEDWDCEDRITGKKPYRAALPPAGHLSAKKAAQCLRCL